MTHWWTFLTKKTKTFLSKHCFMRQPNPERGYLWTFKKIIYEHLWLIDGHFWRKKTKTFLTKHCVMRQPNPERGYLWTFKKYNLWTFMTHWWTFLTKKTKTFMSKKTFYDEKTKYYYITLPFNMVILAPLIRISLPSITIILFQHTISAFFNKKVYWLTRKRSLKYR